MFIWHSSSRCSLDHGSGRYARLPSKIPSRLEVLPIWSRSHEGNEKTVDRGRSGVRARCRRPSIASVGRRLIGRGNGWQDIAGFDGHRCPESTSLPSWSPPRSSDGTLAPACRTWLSLGARRQASPARSLSACSSALYPGLLWCTRHTPLRPALRPSSGSALPLSRNRREAVRQRPPTC
jgi:hypothetical protein